MDSNLSLLRIKSSSLLTVRLFGIGCFAIDCVANCNQRLTVAIPAAVFGFPMKLIPNGPNGDIPETASSAK
ncbi:hypothetical protein M513_02645 [Trichuris suis]|uniref:Uncharacterized protein n=1 Tax=Trichuris suis TaxID=68888 RepID=A0A085MH45_9BILA|nr:hypothetical protein M513_02645 [Trichuris suis]